MGRRPKFDEERMYAMADFWNHTDPEPSLTDVALKFKTSIPVVRHTLARAGVVIPTRPYTKRNVNENSDQGNRRSDSEGQEGNKELELSGVDVQGPGEEQGSESQAS
jgi:hypothetical protein